MSATMHASQQAAPLAYAVPEAAKVLGVSQSFLWLRISSGDVKATRLGRRTLVSRVELERLAVEGF
jgi:excisionase family DNA binding protein